MVGSHSSIALSITLSSLSVSSITWVASSKYSPQFLTPQEICGLCLAYPRYHKMDTMWEHTPTTRAPARHLQYHAVTSAGLYSIHNKYVLDDVWRLCNRTRIKWSSSWRTKISELPHMYCYAAQSRRDVESRFSSSILCLSVLICLERCTIFAPKDSSLS